MILERGVLLFDSNICILGLKWDAVDNIWTIWVNIEKNEKNVMSGYIWVISVINDNYYGNAKLSWK